MTEDWMAPTAYDSGYRFARGYFLAYGDAALRGAIKRLETASMRTEMTAKNRAYIAGVVDYAIGVAQAKVSA